MARWRCDCFPTSSLPFPLARGPDAPELSWARPGKWVRRAGLGGTGSSSSPQPRVGKDRSFSLICWSRPGLNKESRPYKRTAGLHQLAACPALPSVQFMGRYRDQNREGEQPEGLGWKPQSLPVDRQEAVGRGRGLSRWARPRVPEPRARDEI